MARGIKTTLLYAHGPIVLTNPEPCSADFSPPVPRVHSNRDFQCAGAIDGSHIPVRAPTLNHTDYYNRKGWYSIIIQAVVDHNYIFRDVCIGWPGSVHDARVFANSALYQKATSQKILSGHSKQIIG